jgi:hypothetical protein
MMNCPQCGAPLGEQAAECQTCGWKQAATPKKRPGIKELFKDEIFRAVVLSVVAIVLLRHTGFLAIGWRAGWNADLIKVIRFLNGFTRLLVIAGGAVLAVFGFLPALRLARGKEKYSLLIFVLAAAAVLLAAITAVSFILTSANNFS